MNLRETRKKMQRSVVHYVESNPRPDLVLVELLRLKETVDGYIGLLEKEVHCDKDKCDVTP